MLGHAAGLWADLRGERVFLAGGTGFFGCWLVESFLHANRVFSLGARLVVLSRDPAAFARRARHLCSDPALELVAGDVRSFPFPAGRFRCVIHAATDSVVPLSMLAAEEYAGIVDGTRRVLAFAAAACAERLLLVSSGAVYGPQPVAVSHMGEAHPFGAGESAYARGKRAAEALCLAASPKLAWNIARGYAFLGPHLPLEAHFAAGNFLRDALAGRDVAICGDGTPLRSYLYAADLAVWLWTILLRGTGGAYNVGSEEAVSIQALAERVVAEVDPKLRVRVAQQPGSSMDAPARYVPSTQRARRELGLAARIDLDEAIRRTAAWHRSA